MSRRGFTLVELLVVVVIVSGIAWAATPDRPRPFVAGPLPVSVQPMQAQSVIIVPVEPPWQSSNRGQRLYLVGSTPDEIAAVRQFLESRQLGHLDNPGGMGPSPTGESYAAQFAIAWGGTNGNPVEDFCRSRGIAYRIR